MIEWNKRKRDQGERIKTIEKNKVKKMKIEEKKNENRRKKISKNDLADKAKGSGEKWKLEVRSERAKRKGRPNDSGARNLLTADLWAASMVLE